MATQDLECAHIMSRRFRNTRWDPDNALCLCLKCHRFFTEHPAAFNAWLDGIIGEDMLAELRERAQSVRKVDMDDVALSLRRSA